MATAARFTPVAAGNGPVSNTAPESGDRSSVSPEHSPLQQQQPALIVLPAGIHQATTVGNVVPVLDVGGGLDEAPESSNESSGSISRQHSGSEVTTVQGQDSSTEQHSPHFITVTVATDGDTVASHQGYHVQYVDSDLYNSQNSGTPQGQMAYPVYTVGESGTLYPSQGQFYAAGAAGSATYAAAPAHYLVQPAGDDLLAATQRTSPQTTAAVQWLLENYETAEGVSLPRSTLYAHYLRHCNDHKLEPVNAASFGKLIRSVFLGLRTRRLGTRGNSKYHYYGIRVKPGSALTGVMDEGLRSQNSNGPNTGPGQCSSKNHGRFKRNSDSFNINDQVHHHQYLGEGNGAIPDFPDIIFHSPLPDECSMEDVDTLRSIYREHCEAFLDAVLSLEFATVESLWREFWRAQDNNNGEECEEEKYLSKSKLYALCAIDSVQNFMRCVDLQFYQNLVQVLLPDVLRPIPSSLTQAIRNFAKGLESWLTAAMNGCPQQMVNVKLSAVSAFSQSLRRYTSLNHLAQAARAVLHNGQQIAQMLADLNRVDFHNVQEQASWVCQCDYSMVQRLEADFKLTLQQQNSLEQWAVWLKNVVQSVLKPYEGKPNYSKAARQFLLKWSFYSSMVIRDLTLRSAASFGSFHLIRLLYDEYMFYLIEHQVAQATGITPIAVMAELNKSVSTEAEQSNGAIVYASDMNACNGSSIGSDITIKRQKIS